MDQELLKPSYVSSEIECLNANLFLQWYTLKEYQWPGINITSNEL